MRFTAGASVMVVSLAWECRMKDRKVTIRLSHQLYESLEAEALRRMLTVSQLVRLKLSQQTLRQPDCLRDCSRMGR